MMKKLLRRLGLVKIYEIDKWLTECEENHRSKPCDTKTFYFDSGAMSVIHYLRGKLGLDWTATTVGYFKHEP